MYSLQNEMGFEDFAKLNYAHKLHKTNWAFRELAKRQFKVNKLLNVLRNYERTKLIFDTIQETNGVLRECVHDLGFDKDCPVKHKSYGKKFHPITLNELCVDTVHLLNFISDAPNKSDSDCDSLFVIGHSLKDLQIKLWAKYYVGYD